MTHIQTDNNWGPSIQETWNSIWNLSPNFGKKFRKLWAARHFPLEDSSVASRSSEKRLWRWSTLRKILHEFTQLKRKRSTTSDSVTGIISSDNTASCGSLHYRNERKGRLENGKTTDFFLGCSTVASSRVGTCHGSSTFFTSFFTHWVADPFGEGCHWIGCELRSSPLLHPSLGPETLIRSLIMIMGLTRCVTLCLLTSLLIVRRLLFRSPTSSHLISSSKVLAASDELYHLPGEVSYEWFVPSSNFHCLLIFLWK